jgi:hypothetical protein
MSWVRYVAESSIMTVKSYLGYPYVKPGELANAYEKTADLKPQFQPNTISPSSIKSIIDSVHSTLNKSDTSPQQNTESVSENIPDINQVEQPKQTEEILQEKSETHPELNSESEQNINIDDVINKCVENLTESIIESSNKENTVSDTIQETIIENKEVICEKHQENQTDILKEPESKPEPEKEQPIQTKQSSKKKNKKHRK